MTLNKLLIFLCFFGLNMNAKCSQYEQHRESSQVCITQYVVDAFTDKVFHGNPAAVCVLEKWLSDENMINMAKENNLRNSL